MSDAVLIPLIVGASLLIFPLFWSAVVWLVGFSWRKIAADHPAADWPSDGYKVSWQSGRIGMSSYGSALNFVATDEGLYARPTLFFRMGHPPIFIPWTEIESVDPALFGGCSVRTRAGHSLTVSQDLADAVKAATDAAHSPDLGTEAG